MIESRQCRAIQFLRITNWSLLEHNGRNCAVARPNFAKQKSIYAESRAPALLPLTKAKFGGEKAMNYLIISGVVAMMSLYTVIIARCLKETEW